MTEPLKAGERLAAPRPEAGPHRPPRTPRPPKKPRTGGGWFRRVLGALFAFGVMGLLAASAGGYMAYRHFAADLPDVDGLRNYQPPVMTRVFGSDSRLIADFATERRIFVPYSAIPD